MVEHHLEIIKQLTSLPNANEIILNLKSLRLSRLNNYFSSCFEYEIQSLETSHNAAGSSEMYSSITSIRKEKLPCLGGIEYIHRIFIRTIDSGEYENIGWMLSSDVKCCTVCSKRFTAFKLQHHCRACGNVVCYTCARHKVCLQGFKHWGQLRVCSQCFYGQEPIAIISNKDDGELIPEFYDIIQSNQLLQERRVTLFDDSHKVYRSKSNPKPNRYQDMGPVRLTSIYPGFVVRCRVQNATRSFLYINLCTNSHVPYNFFIHYDHATVAPMTDPMYILCGAKKEYLNGYVVVLDLVIHPKVLDLVVNDANQKGRRQGINQLIAHLIKFIRTSFDLPGYFETIQIDNIVESKYFQYSPDLFPTESLPSKKVYYQVEEHLDEDLIHEKTVELKPHRMHTPCGEVAMPCKRAFRTLFQIISHVEDMVGYKDKTLEGQNISFYGDDASMDSGSLDGEDEMNVICTRELTDQEKQTYADAKILDRFTHRVETDPPPVDIAERKAALERGLKFIGYRKVTPHSTDWTTPNHIEYKPSSQQLLAKSELSRENAVHEVPSQWGCEPFPGYVIKTSRVVPPMASRSMSLMRAMSFRPTTSSFSSITPTLSSSSSSSSSNHGKNGKNGLNQDKVFINVLHHPTIVPTYHGVGSVRTTDPPPEVVYIGTETSNLDKNGSQCRVFNIVISSDYFSKGNFYQPNTHPVNGVSSSSNDHAAELTLGQSIMKKYLNHHDDGKEGADHAKYSIVPPSKVDITEKEPMLSHVFDSDIVKRECIQKIISIVNDACAVHLDTANYLLPRIRRGFIGLKSTDSNGNPVEKIPPMQLILHDHGSVPVQKPSHKHELGSLLRYLHFTNSSSTNPTTTSSSSSSNAAPTASSPTRGRAFTKSNPSVITDRDHHTTTNHFSGHDGTKSVNSQSSSSVAATAAALSYRIRSTLSHELKHIFHGADQLDTSSLDKSVFLFEGTLNVSHVDSKLFILKAASQVHILLGWQITLISEENDIASHESGVQDQIYVITACRKDALRRTEYKLTDHELTDRWVHLQRVEHHGVSFRLLRQVLKFSN